jgi:hypothetical protein
MTSLNDITYSIFNIVRPKYNSTAPLTYDLIKYLVKTLRAQLIRQESNKGYSIDSWVIQDLGMIPVQLVDAAEDCNINEGCMLLRTAVKMPSFVELHQKQLITRIAGVNRLNKPFDIIPYERAPFEGLNKYTKNTIKAFTKDLQGYIYFVTSKDNDLALMMDYVNVQGVLEDPEDAKLFNTCSGPCYSDDSAFPIKHWMVPIIIEMAIKKFLLTENNQPIDFESDGKPSLEQVVKPAQ